MFVELRKSEARKQFAGIRRGKYLLFIILEDRKEKFSMNPLKMMRIMDMKKRFDASHPKFGAFLNAVGRDAMVEGTIVEINVTTPDGVKKVTNLKLNRNDIEMLKEIKNMQ